ncbi:hypothetical protein [Piscinibacter koreensis]|uniref:Uncharacterized protein n=1 Tax=Piscinibacter koreensis TaxID=2742824 RepID=A0A7Y6NN63_9BURK|nr:hypothetical protein [Schlegelella koreensis]NUZ06252.1 hypothetical protein [Schlegelella koreensis]
MDGETSQRLASALLQRAGDPADPSRVADAVGELWRSIDATLNPLIGDGGVRALYQRSVQLATRRAPSFAPLQASLHAAVDLDRLRATLARCSSAEASAGGAALIQTFCELLADLIGARLADRLLDPTLAEFMQRADSEAVAPT